MMQTLQFAATEAHASDPGLFEALGIDWKLLLLQGLAFLVLVWFLGKFVYPVLTKAIDDRQAKIDQSTKLAEQASKHAEEAEAKVQELLKEARVQADDVLATAHKEASAMLEEAEVKAKKRADHIVSDARAQLDQDVLVARQNLRSETKKLVVMATEKIVKQKIDASSDAKLIDQALKEAS